MSDFSTFSSNMEVSTSCLAPNRTQIQRYKNVFTQVTLVLLYNINKYRKETLLPGPSNRPSQ